MLGLLIAVTNNTRPTRRGGGNTSPLKTTAWEATFKRVRRSSSLAVVYERNAVEIILDSNKNSMQQHQEVDN